MHGLSFNTEDSGVMIMHFPKPTFRPMPLTYKILSVVLIAGFLFIGLVGLVLPIIPGILFLLLAVYLMTRVSRRISAIVHKHPWFNRNMRKLDAVSTLSIGEKTRLSLLLTARALISGIESGIAFFRKKGGSQS
jgi:uncharacterized membrane protein YbaN (DUF454 family)